MNKIETNTWKEYNLKDIGFSVFHGCRQKQADREDGTIPLLTAGKENQGVATYIGNPLCQYEDSITVDMFGNCFFHKGVYSGDDNIYFFINSDLNDYIKIFIASIINKQNSILYDFKSQFRQPQADTLTIVLPSKTNNTPDWEYMESYMKNIMQESEENIENLQNIKDYKNKVDINKWQEYRLGDLFYKCILNKKANFKKISDVSLEKTDEFDLPLVNAKHYNNGIMYYGRSSDFDSEIMTLDIVQNGAATVGDVYAQPQRTGVLEDAYLIKAYDNITSADVLQFLATVIQKDIKQHFSYDDKCTWDKAKEMLIHLPANPNGKPDWKYMESFMKNIMEDTQSKLDKLVCC